MIVKYILKYCLLNLLLFFSCAVKSPPPGGAPDLSSPYIKSIFPNNGAANISLDENIEINFNEMIDPNSIKSSIIINPNIDIKINSYGKKINIRPINKWPKNSKFTVKIKRSISDYKGNKMNNSKILTYSTGSKIYNGLINGSSFEIDFPKELTLFLKLLKILPNRLYLYLIKKLTKLQKL